MKSKAVIFVIASLFLLLNQISSNSALASSSQFTCIWSPEVPIIDGFVSEGEWKAFQSLRIPYWITYKNHTIFGAEPWDLTDKECQISLLAYSSHLYICLQIQDDYLSNDYSVRILQIYLDDHLSNYTDRRGLLLGLEYYYGHIYPNNIVNLFDGIAYRYGADGPDDVELGGTRDINVAYRHTSNGKLGENGTYIFEFDLPLKRITNDVYDASSKNMDIKITWGEAKYMFTDSSYWETTFNIIIPNIIEIDSSSVTDSRCDVGETQTVAFHLCWKHNLTDAKNITVNIKDQKLVSDSSGWVTFEVSRDFIIEASWKITGILGCDQYEVIVNDPSIIWDQVGLNIESGKRYDLGWNKLNWVGEYFYDRQPFKGTFSLNDTLIKIKTGKYAYQVVSISDSMYGLTKFVSNDFSIILDRVNVKLSIVDDRIDVLSKPELEWPATYEYDDSPFQGEVNIKTISGQTSVPTPVGKGSFTVESIEDEKYGLTAFTSNQVDCIWDRVKITQGGVSKSMAKTGDTESVWFKAVYEYDGREFAGELTGDGGMNKIFVNGIPMTWSSFDKVWKYSTKLDDNGKLTFEVTSVEDMQYKLTTFIDVAGPQSITWEKPFLETPVGIASIAAVLAIIAAGVIFFLRKRI